MPICSLLRRYHVIKCGLGVNQEADLTSARDFNIASAHSQSISIDVLTDSQRFETSSPSVLFLRIEKVQKTERYAYLYQIISRRLESRQIGPAYLSISIPFQKWDVILKTF